MATKTLNTRITLKADTTANWSNSTLVLLKGEMAIEIPESGEYKMKIGDGVNTFGKLSYVAMTPTEIKALISSGAVQTVSLSTGTNNGTIAITVDGVKTDNIAVKGLGSAAYTNSGAYATAGHGHSISGITGLQTALDGKAAAGHTHDDRYYTETEMNTKLAGKANSSHSHGAGDISSVNASAIQGVIGLDHLPAGALERCKIVKDDTARFALTKTAVQTGDTVKVTDTGKMYFIVDDSKLSTEAGYEVYTAGSATSVPWSGVTGKPSTFTPSAHKHTRSEITDFPTSMPASDVYAWAKAASKPSYTKAEVGLGNVDNTADANKSVKYANSAGSAIKLQTYKKGSTTETYGTDYLLFAQWEDDSNVRFKVDNYTVKVNYADNAGIANSASSVDWSGVQNKPSTFTPSAHTHTIANVTGLQDALNGKAASSHTHTIANVTGLQSALDGKASSGHTHSSFSGEIHFSTGTYKDPANGISTAIKASGGIAADVFYEGTTKLSDKYQPKGSYAAASHTHTIAQITNLQSTLDGKSNNGHTHNYAGSSSAGGAATSANKLNTNAGNHVNPVYFSDGIPVACTYSISANVPFDAKFTDTNTWRPCVNNLTSDSTDQSLSAAQGKILKDKLDKLVPIGYIFIWNNRKLTNFNETLSGAPALTSAQAVHDYFGFGTWQQVSDTFLYGNPNSQGGASTVSLGVGNMPSHTHSIPALSGWAANNGAHAHNVRAKYTNNCATKSGGSARANGGGNNTSDWRFGDTDSQGVHGHNVSTNASTTGSNGSGSAFSIMPPYKGVYIWQRIA